MYTQCDTDTIISQVADIMNDFTFCLVQLCGDQYESVTDIRPLPPIYVFTVDMLSPEISLYEVWVYYVSYLAGPFYQLSN